MDSLRDVLPNLVALGPRFMTVTYGAMGTTRIRTVEIAAMIHNEFELECACHLTCVGAHSDQVDAQLDHIHRHGIENIVALRGDPPRGQDSFQAVKGGFSRYDLGRSQNTRAVRFKIDLLRQTHPFSHSRWGCW